MAVIKMTDLDLRSRRVLVREDLNVPIQDGKITSDQRIKAALPTLRHISDEGAALLIMSHRGRPDEGQYDVKASLQPVAEHLSRLLDEPVSLVRDYLDVGLDVKPGEILLLENVRFNMGEKANDEKLSQQYASLCDVFVMDAFGTAHRAQASTHGVARFAPQACAGPLLVAELEALGRALDSPSRPMVAIVGGAKVSTKLTVLNALSKKVDRLIPGGGIANTFIAAAGFPVGQSLYEPDLVAEAKRLMDMASDQGGEIPIPKDVVVAKEFSQTAEAKIKSVSEVEDDDLILDIGPDTAERYAEIINDAGTVVWNGPVGVFEFDQFAQGTRRLAESIADSSAFSIAGGGDTLAAVEKFAIAEHISYISTGGGAFLEFLEGKQLPAVAILQKRGENH